jgi:hypothetical protein
MTMQANFSTAHLPFRTFTKDILVKGKPAKKRCIEIAGQQYTVSCGFANVVSLDDEWFEDVKDPDHVIQTIKRSGLGADIFAFWQRPPDQEPRFNFYKEWESVAALPVRGYDHWFSKQISSRLRSQIRKAIKEGLEIRETAYDDDFVRGMTEIFNETPVRQGRPFWHYGKDFETIKKQFSTYIYREQMIGAYLGGEMVGFIMLGDSGNFGLTGQIISKVKHRDKVTNNALIGKAVEICEKRKLPWLVYGYWTNDSLAEFKRRCGFEEQRVPRYFVPLSLKGAVALKSGLHRGWKNALPSQIKSPLKKLRKFLYGLRTEGSAERSLADTSKDSN